MPNQSPSSLPMRPPQPTPERVIRLAALPTGPHMARVFMSQSARQFRLSAECAETTRLLVSELVTNAIRQTGRVEGQPTALPAERVAVVVLRIRLIAHALRIEVWDSDSTPPQRSDDLTFASESGWGLLLVELLSRRWGSYPISDNAAQGKIVWAEVALR